MAPRSLLLFFALLSLAACVPSSHRSAASSAVDSSRDARERDPLATHTPQLVPIPHLNPAQLRDVLSPELAAVVIDARDAGAHDATAAWERVLVWREQSPCRPVTLGSAAAPATLCMRVETPSRGIQLHTLELRVNGAVALEVPVGAGPALGALGANAVPTTRLQVVLTAEDGAQLVLRDPPREGCDVPAGTVDAAYLRARSRVCSARGAYALAGGAYARTR